MSVRQKPPFWLQPPTHSDALTWACKAWSELGFSVMKSGFKRHVKQDEKNEPFRDELVERLQTFLAVNEELRDKDDVVADKS